MEVLLVSPVKPLFIILAKAVPYFVLSFVNLTIRMPCVQKKRVFLPGYRRSVTRNWRSAYEGSSRLRSNEVPGGDFKR